RGASMRPPFVTAEVRFRGLDDDAHLIASMRPPFVTAEVPPVVSSNRMTVGCFNEAAVRDGGSPVETYRIDHDDAVASMRPPFVTAEVPSSCWDQAPRCVASMRPPFVTAEVARALRSRDGGSPRLQ